MKNKKDVIDLLHNADDSTIEKIVSSNPQYDRKKADRLYKQIERRVEGIDGDFTGGEVSGVEHYRPHRLRRAASMAACLAIVGAGVGTAFALRSGAPEDKSPASKISTGTVQTSTVQAAQEMASTASAISENSDDETAPASNIDKQHIIDLCSSLSYDSVSLSAVEKTTSTGKNFVLSTVENIDEQRDNVRGTTWYKNICEESNNGKITSTQATYSFTCNGSQAVIFDNDCDMTAEPFLVQPLQHSETHEQNAAGNLLGYLDSWSITGTDVIAGRECTIVHGIYSDDSANNFTYYIDNETGVFLKEIFDSPTTEKDGVITEARHVEYEVTDIVFNDTTGFVTPSEFREFISTFELPDNNYDLSFLGWNNENNVPKYPTNENGQTYGTDLGDPDNNIGPPDLQAVQGNHGINGYCYTTDLMLDPYAGLKPAEIVQKQQERSASVKRGVRYMKVYDFDGKTVIDTFTAGGNSEDSAVPLPISLIYASLDTLEYHAISCDGLPTHKLTTPAGTVYLLHLGETAQDSYVWRRPSLIADDDNEAPLTEEVFTAIYENWDDLNIVKTDYFHN